MYFERVAMIFNIRICLLNELNLQLHFIPAGMTDKLQPLDRNCFGALKDTACRLFREI